jgi:hypothetical protein
MSRYPLFDRAQLRVLPLAEREHDMTLAEVLPLDATAPPFKDAALPLLARRMLTARSHGRPVILGMGAHVIKQGLSRFVIALMERGLVSCLMTSGAGAIHDFELALVGATTESVARYIREGQFGLWQETGRLNDIIRQGNELGLGLGEAVGRAIAEGDFPHADVSVFAAAYRRGIPATVHVGIGYDITHEHPNCDGAALGAASYRDFLIFARVTQDLAGGVFLNFGSAVMGPEVYLKALAMARNVARGQGEDIRRFTTAVFDLVALPDGHRREAAKTDPLYYFRPWKTILARTVAGGGQSYYFSGDHRQTIPTLWAALVGQTG